MCRLEGRYAPIPYICICIYSKPSLHRCLQRRSSNARLTHAASCVSAIRAAVHVTALPLRPCGAACVLQPDRTASSECCVPRTAAVLPSPVVRLQAPVSRTPVAATLPLLPCFLISSRLLPYTFHRAPPCSFPPICCVDRRRGRHGLDVQLAATLH